MHAATQNIYDVFMISPQLIINARIKNLISLKKMLMLYARLHSKFCFQKIQRWIKCFHFSVMNNEQITFKLRNFNA